jgi:hypothetical protein
MRIGGVSSAINENRFPKKEVALNNLVYLFDEERNGL